MNGKAKNHDIEENVRDFVADDDGCQWLAYSSRHEGDVPCCSHRNALEREDESADGQPYPAQGIHTQANPSKLLGDK